MAATPTPAPSVSASGSAASNSTFISIPATAAVGGLSLTQPPQFSTSYFKIAPSQPVTFGWSFDNYLYIKPTSLTVAAICENGYTYPVGPTNGVIPGSATTVVWDPYAYNQANPNQPLPQATYELAIYDQRGLGALGQGGVFNPNTQLKFALYTPQPYTPLASGWSCPGCSGAPPTPLSGTFATVTATLLCMFLSGFAFFRMAVHRQNRE